MVDQVLMVVRRHRTGAARFPGSPPSFFATLALFGLAAAAGGITPWPTSASTSTSALGGPSGGGGDESPPTEFTQLDLEKVEGAEACGECHVLEHERWQQTPHATGFKTLHRKEQAEEIAQRMGFHLIKRNSICLRCHYTPVRVEHELRARSGVSCESCHGEAADWIEVHNDYGSDADDWSQETAEHREMRIAASREAGMRRPEDLYGLAASCFECHFVPHEQLVNVGGHSSGATTFDLWQKSQGEIRHNFLAAQRGGSRENAVRGATRRRVLSVTGAALSVEYALRGLARASDADGLYVKAMQRRLRTVLADLGEVQRRLQLDDLDVALRAASTVRPEPENADSLVGAAEQVRERTLALLATNDGSDWAALDAYLNGEPEGDLPELPDYRPPPEPSDQVTDLPDAEPSAGTASEAGAASEVALADFDPTVLPNGEPVIFEAVGEKKARLRAVDAHGTLGGACSSCHAPQNQWWFGDTHYATADRLFDADPRAIEIARNYGVARADLARGDQVCANCHATVVSGRESREVQDGVGCESCHGAASDYLEPHQEGEKELGTARPGYRAGLERGMVELRNLDTRLQRCTSCHYINDERLISSGHPSGRGFDFVEAMNGIRHWDHASASAAEVRRAAGTALERRGPVPAVQIVTPLSQRPRPPRSPAGDVSVETADRVTSQRSPGGSTATGTRSRGRAAVASEQAARPEARRLRVDPDAPLPEVEEDGSLDDLLESVAARIDALRKRVDPATESEEDPP